MPIEESLLLPLSDISPCGDDLSFSAEFDRVRELRREDDASLDQGAWVVALKRSDWPAVVALCTGLLTTQTKDLRLAGWLADALGRTQGHAGLAEGLALYAALWERHGHDLHPRSEGGDSALRVGSLTWLLAQVRALAVIVPVLTDSSGAQFSLADVRHAPSRGKAGSASGADAAALSATDQVERAKGQTPAVQLLAAMHGCHGAHDALDRLQAVVDPELGAESPSFAEARRALDEALSDIERIAKGRGLLSNPAVAAGPPSLGDSDASPLVGEAALTHSVPSSRQEALNQLRQVADFFRRTEPHSPVAYLADKAASWGEMPLHVWLRAVLKEPGSLAQLEDLLGVEALSGADSVA